MDKEKVREVIDHCKIYSDSNVLILCKIAEMVLDDRLVEPMSVEEIKKLLPDTRKPNLYDNDYDYGFSKGYGTAIDDCKEALVRKVGKQEFKINPNGIFEFEPLKSCCGNLVKGTYLEGKKVICCKCKKVIKEI